MIVMALVLVAALSSCSNDNDGNGTTDSVDQPGGGSNTSVSGNAARPSSEPALLAMTGASGLEGSSKVPFTVVLAEPASAPVQLSYTTSDGTAEAELDYKTVESGTVTIPPGEQSTIIEIETIADGEIEDDETVNLTITPSGSSTAELGGPITATGIIKDGDHIPALAVTATEAQEGGQVKFQISVLAYSFQDLMVEYATVDASAVAGEDYAGTSGFLTVSADEGFANLEIETFTDDDPELRESFLMSFKLSESSALLLGGPGSPLDPFGPLGGLQDPADPLVRPEDPFGPLGGLQDPADPLVRPEDPFGPLGGLQDPFGSPFGGPATNATVLAAGIILDDAPIAASPINDAPANVSPLKATISDSSAEEGDTITFRVTLSDIAADNMSFRYTMYGSGNDLGLPGSADADVDFIAETGRVTIPAGSITARLQVRTLIDEDPEGDEVFSVRLDDPQPAQLDGAVIVLDDNDATATGTIIDRS